MQFNLSFLLSWDALLGCWQNTVINVALYNNKIKSDLQDVAKVNGSTESKLIR